jgi:hypothetical protein
MHYLILALGCDRNPFRQPDDSLRRPIKMANIAGSASMVYQAGIGGRYIHALAIIDNRQSVIDQPKTILPCWRCATGTKRIINQFRQCATDSPFLILHAEQHSRFGVILNLRHCWSFLLIVIANPVMKI